MVYMYTIKYSYISWWYVYYTKVQLHVSAINVGHLQVVLVCVGKKRQGAWSGAV